MDGRKRCVVQKDGDQLREYKAMHEENFLSSWLREDVEGTEEEMEKMNKEAKEEESKRGNKEVKREKETAVIKRRCVDPIYGCIFEEFSTVEEWLSVGDSCGGSCGGSGGFSVCACFSFVGGCSGCGLSFGFEV